MYTAFYDDSGSAAESLAVVVGGFVALDTQWVEFTRNWNDSLRRFGISRLHMREFAHSIGEFSQFRNDRSGREWFLNQLLGHIRLRVTYSNAHAVLMSDYHAVNGTYALDYGFPPYALAGRTCIARINLWAEKCGIGKGNIRHVFEAGSAGSGKLFDSVLRDHKTQITFKPKSECVPLQAADLFAYEMLAANRAVFERGITDFDALRYPVRQLKSLLREPLDWGTYTQKDLEEFCAKAGIPRRDSLVAKATAATT